MSLFTHGCVNLCDVMQCGTLSSMVSWHPLLKNVLSSIRLWNQLPEKLTNAES